MSFTWRKLWSDPVGEHLELKFAVAGGAVLEPEDGRISSFSSNGPGSKDPLPRGTLLCCWNGALVLHTGNCGRPAIELTLLRYENNDIWRLKLPLHFLGLVRYAVALNDGTLFVAGGTSSHAIVRDVGNGQMEIVQSSEGLDVNLGEPVTPWLNGIITDALTTGDIAFKTLPQGIRSPLGRYERCAVRKDADKKYACALLRQQMELHEWDAQGRERVFSLPRGHELHYVTHGQHQTCRGRAFLVCWKVDALSQAFVYLGNGRCAKVAPGLGEWAAYGNRAYKLRDGVLKCYKVLETPNMLVNLCACIAASLGLSDERLQTVPVELRELVSSWT